MKFSTLLSWILLPWVLVAAVGSACAQCLLNHAGPGTAGTGYTAFETTGNTELDAFFEREIRKTLMIFGLPAVDAYHYDDTGSPNAVAIPIPGGMDQISFGLGLTTLLYRDFRLNPRAAVAGVISHEMAHILQYEKGGLDALPEFKKELQADFLAGYFLGYTHKIELATDQDAETFFDLFYSMGDTLFFSSDHHGTPEQRKRCALQGFHHGKNLEPIDRVYLEGIRFVRTMKLRE